MGALQLSISTEERGGLLFCLSKTLKVFVFVLENREEKSRGLCSAGDWLIALALEKLIIESYQYWE